MLSPALLGSGPVWWVGQKIHKEWRRDISDTAAETGSLLPAWVGGLGRSRPPPSSSWRNQEARKLGEKSLMQVIQQHKARGFSAPT